MRLIFIIVNKGQARSESAKADFYQVGVQNFRDLSESWKGIKMLMEYAMARFPSQNDEDDSGIVRTKICFSDVQMWVNQRSLIDYLKRIG